MGLWDPLSDQGLHIPRADVCQGSTLNKHVSWLFFFFFFWWHALCFYSPFGGDGLSSGLVSVVCLLRPFSHAGHAVCRALRCFFKHPLDDSCQPLSLAAQGDHVPTCTRAWERPVLPRAASLWTGFEKTKLGSVCGYDGADSCSLKHIALSGSSSDSGFDTESN